MQPEIRIIAEKKLAGKCLQMSLAANRTGELWRSFMPGRMNIRHRVSDDLISMQMYNPSFDFSNFDINAVFTKWAAVEVSEYDEVPDDMTTCILPGGLYAVFAYKGLSTDDSIFKYIFSSWLPASAYLLDERPHFEILGARYKNGDPDSEEEICIPVRLK